MFKFTEVASCRESLALNINYQNSKQIKKCIKGDLEVFIEVATGMLMFKMEEFQYGINPNDQVIYQEKDPQFKLVFCLDADPDNCWIIKINENIQLIFLCLSERCKLIQRTASRIIIKQIETAQSSSKSLEEPMVGANYAQMKEKAQETGQEQSTESLLIQASKTFNKGLKLAGKVFARGFEKLGEFISKKVEPAQQQVQVSDDTKKLIQTSVGASKKILQVTSEQFAALFRVGKTEAVKMIDKFEKSEKGKSLEQKGDYKTVKTTVKTGIHVLVNLYEGLSQGLSEAGTGLAKGATKVIGAKYGKDAGEASYGVVQGAKNVAGIMKVPKNEAKKMFKEEEQSK